MAPEPKKRIRKLPPLLREVAQVQNETLAFLYGGPEQQPGDYQRNLNRAEIIRQDFVQFCTANLHFSNWRQAWAAFINTRPAETPCVSVSSNPVVPPWRQRLAAVAALSS
jgi:hypothetical protein